MQHITIHGQKVMKKPVDGHSLDLARKTPPKSLVAGDDGDRIAGRNAALRFADDPIVRLGRRRHVGDLDPFGVLRRRLFEEPTGVPDQQDRRIHEVSPSVERSSERVPAFSKVIGSEFDSFPLGEGK